MLQDRAVPTRVVASAATGIATSEPYNCVPQTEDTITLMVDWESTTSSKHRGTGVYTASWTAPLKAGVHSAQHWYYMGEKVRLRRHTSQLIISNAFDYRATLLSTRRTVDTMSPLMIQASPGITLSSTSNITNLVSSTLTVCLV